MSKNEPFLLQHYNRWSDFKVGIVEQLYPGTAPIRGRFLFRGQPNATWTLSSSFDRSFPDVHGKNRETLEAALVEEFKRQCENDSSLKTIASDPVGLLALAQHHGLPTRLLDWSDSPYVAAFFAYQHAIRAYGTTENLFKGEAVAIWILDTDHYIWSERYGAKIVTPASWDNKRMFMQSGCFTLSRTPHKSLQEYVQSFDAEGVGALRLVTVSMIEATHAIGDLDLMGINFATMFPDDIDGRARAAISRAVLRSIKAG
jgi:hypothetical protein